MAINAWWGSDGSQRYWMEVITTSSIGSLLQSPKIPSAKWSYELVSVVQAGDRVLHWDRTGRVPRLRGWSEVVGEPTVVPNYTWQPRGTAGRAAGVARTSEGWQAPLGGLRLFPSGPTGPDLQPLRAALL